MLAKLTGESCRVLTPTGAYLLVSVNEHNPNYMRMPHLAFDVERVSLVLVIVIHINILVNSLIVTIMNMIVISIVVVIVIGDTQGAAPGQGLCLQ